MALSNHGPLSRARCEYDRLQLPPLAQARILQRVVARTERAPRGGWGTGLAMGFAVGCAIMTGFYATSLVLSPAATPASSPQASAAPAAVALKVQGVAKTWVDEDSAKRPISTEQRIGEHSWLETQHQGALSIAIGPHRATVRESTQVKLEALRDRQLAFSMSRGTMDFTVDPLPPGATLSVWAGELLVQVVGTVFTVERQARCSKLVVTEGRVRATFRRQTELIGAGQSRSYCEAPLPESRGLTVPPAGLGPQDESNALAEPASETASDSGAAGATARSLTREEQHYREGLNALRRGDSATAEQRLTTYLRRYPGGTFTQDARFQLVRIAYGARDLAKTVTLGRQFLATGGSSKARNGEVGLLVAQSLLQKGEGHDEARGLLAPLVEGAAASSTAQAEQVVYLYILATSRSGHHDEGQLWAQRYLQKYPSGRYVQEVKKIVGQ